jgi:two-component system, cell cycle response regulator
MRTSVPAGHRDAPPDGLQRLDIPHTQPMTIGRGAARTLLYEFMIDCQLLGGELVLTHARHIAEHACARRWPDVRALAGYVVVVTRWAYDQSGPWAARHVGSFVRWAHASNDPLATALSLITRARAGLWLNVESGPNPLDDLVSAYIVAERISTRVERGFALHEIASSLHEMRMWELSTEIYDRVARITAGLRAPRVLVGALVANRFYTLATELLHATESGHTAHVARLAHRVAALPEIGDLDPAVPAEWHQEITAYAAICRTLVHADRESADTIASLLSAPCGRRTSRRQMLGLLRCVLGWHHLQHDRPTAAGPLIRQGAADLLDGARTAAGFRSFALWLRATARDGAARDGLHAALGDYHAALYASADDARHALVRSTRARLQTEHLRAERDRYAHESITDPLTGLANRRALEAHLRALSRGLTLLIVDVDRFKQVNDRFGHDVGDRVLRRIGRILCDCVRPGDLAARLGGDEFVLVLDTAEADVAIRRGHEVRDQVRVEAWHTIHPALKVAASVGVASGEQGAMELYRTADAALYAAKRAGGACVRASVTVGGSAHDGPRNGGDTTG